MKLSELNFSELIVFGIVFFLFIILMKMHQQYKKNIQKLK